MDEVNDADDGEGNWQGKRGFVECGAGAFNPTRWQATKAAASI